MKEGIEMSRDARAEVLLRFFDKAKDIDALKGKSIGEVMASDQSKREFLSTVSEEEFIDLLNGLNGILRGKPKEKWGMDGQGVMLSGFLGSNTTPDFKDKLPLLEELYAKMQEMNIAERTLEDIGLLLGVGIVEIHPYMDGNGRTARLVYSLMRDGLNENQLREQLNSFGKAANFNIGTAESFVQDLIAKRILSNNVNGVSNLFAGRPVKELAFNEAVSPNLQEEFRRFLVQCSSEHAAFLSMYEYVNAHELDCLTYFPATERFGRTLPERHVIQLERLTPLLDEEDIRKVMERFWEIKKETTELLLDSIVHPEKPEYAMKQWIKDERTRANEGSIIDYIKRSILRTRYDDQ